jgi:membrane protein DedA with SNARE-associated domain
MTDALPIAPHAIAQWLPGARMTGFFLAAVMVEDVATVGAGLLLAAGDVSWPTTFTACFLGIWLGDAGLYGLARFAGREWFERSSLRRFEAKVARSELRFGKFGTPILIFSRMIPGARLPTYFAAGFLRVPLPRFLLVTGAASFAWTFLILFLARTFGERLMHWLDVYKYAGLVLLPAAVAIVILWQILRRRST